MSTAATIAREDQIKVRLQEPCLASGINPRRRSLTAKSRPCLTRLELAANNTHLFNEQDYGTP